MGSWQKPSIRNLLAQQDCFATCVEVVTSRGIIAERNGRRVLELARALADHPRVTALSITDNPGGNAMLGADTLGTDLIARGQEVIIHLSCKDWNRNALQSRGWELASGGFENILALSGDCPTSGYEGQAAGVFDIDSVGLLQMFTEMNRGLEATVSGKRSASSMQRTNFFCGAVVNNYKLYEREVMPQYFKLAMKIKTGAQFIINQLGYDARKMDELLKYMKLHGLDVPVLGNVYVLNGSAARFFNAGKMAGCLVTDELLELCQYQAKSPDKGKSFFLEFAAKQVAVCRGLGFQGAYLGGHLKYEDFERIFELVDSFSTDDWKTFAIEIQFNRPGEFFFFEQDDHTQLSSDQINRDYLASKTPEGLQTLRRRVSWSYRLNREVHKKIFEKGSSGFAIGKKIYKKIDSVGPRVRGLTHKLEHALKIVSFDCRDCGDCSLPDIAYLCPESECAKNQRNGPCGGTRDGKCEIGEKDCIWSRAYDRLKPYREEEQMLARPVVYKDGAMQGTSAWANTFLERDHHAKVESIREKIQGKISTEDSTSAKEEVNLENG